MQLTSMDTPQIDTANRDTPVITAQMISAGVRVVLDEYDPDDPNIERFVKRLYYAMASISR